MDLSAWRRFLFIAVLGTFMAPLSAHHSTAEFDYTKQVTIKGIVKEVQWTNPHSFIQLMVDGSNGEKVQWSVEIGSPSLNVNMGWRKNSVKAGDIVTMELSPARNGKPYGTLRVLTFADGTATQWRCSARARANRCAASGRCTAPCCAAKGSLRCAAPG